MLDIDGVLYQWTKTARYMLRDIMPDSPYTKDGPLGIECTEWDYIKHNVSPKHYKWLWKEGVKLGLFRHGHLFPGSIKAVRELAKMGSLVAVTQRPRDATADTLDWIAFHRLPFQEVHVLHGGSKTQVAECDVYLDDRPENVIELKAAFPDALVCLPDRDWNRGFIAAEHGVIRTYTWSDFVELVKRKKLSHGLAR